MTPSPFALFDFELAAEARAWLARWGVAPLEAGLQIRFSSRLTRSWARCQPTRGRIAIQHGLAAAPAQFLREILAHELAHYAAYTLHGAAIAPHGREWRALMHAVDVPARTRLPPPPGWREPAPRRAETRYYLHRCPACRAERIARRVVRRWRCGRCVDRGRDGLLEVYRLAHAPRGVPPS